MTSQNASVHPAIEYLAHQKPRPGQIDMIIEANESLSNGGFHLAAAPTGIGKTAAALAAALEVAKKSPMPKKIFFLTSRQSQHRIVVDTVRRLNQLRKENGKITLVDMIGQSGMCVQPFAKESSLVFSILCSQARKTRNCRPWITHAPSLTQRILDSPLHVDELVELTKIHRENDVITQTCPWKVARESVKHADIFVGDYNHLFDDGVREVSLEAMGVGLSDIIIIVDEAHNLANRIRLTMEKRLTRTIVRNAAMEVEEHLGALQEHYADGGPTANEDEIDLYMWLLEVMKACRKTFSELFHTMHSTLPTGKDEQKVEASDFVHAIHSACDLTEGILGQKTIIGSNEQITPLIPRKNRIEIIQQLLAKVEIEVDTDADNGAFEPDSHRFAEIIGCVNRFGGGTAMTLIFDTKGRDGRITTHLLDPGLVSKPVFENSSGAILMSGTLYPPTMYANLLGLPSANTTSRSYKSPFSGSRRPVLLAQDVTTKYTERGHDMNMKIRAQIEALVKGTPGNIAVFVPSYKMLNEIFADAHFSGIRKVTESRDWTKQDIDGIVDLLRDGKDSGQRILLCGVFGARLSEGVDYNGGILDAVACVGIPNPPPSVLNDSLKEYVAERFGKDLAWQYTSTQPAINSILQAMGRPIRSIGDRALILLLDKRHSDRVYSKCYPSDLMMSSTSGPETTTSFAKRFFAKVHTTTDE
ncbi:MAG: ATP-dependent DNA helicase [Candidatus Poseidoniaceae archaeon]|nr:ATP-dependent DNA helicase [Candidatus Poseidoniaceae archaeon]